MKVERISWPELHEVWSTQLWPGRTTAIEPTSAIIFGHYPYEYDVNFALSPPTFLGVREGDSIVAVNSGHMTNRSYRSRGLFVHPLYRGLGLAKALLQETVLQARAENALFVWTMPRRSALKAYESVGFLRLSDWFETETSEANCFAMLPLE